MARIISLDGVHPVEVPLTVRFTDLPTIVTGVLTPWCGLEDVLDVQGPFVIWGLWIPEPALTRPAELRDLYGRGVFARAKRIYVEDELSLAWLEHFGVDRGKAQIAPSWEWLLQLNAAPIEGMGAYTPADAIEHTLRGSTGAICCSRPLLGEVKFGGPNPNHVMRRWAAKYGAGGAVVGDSADGLEWAARQLPRFGISSETIERSQNIARAVLGDIAARVGGPKEELTRILGEPGGDGAPDGPRTLALGSVFDPATHYTAHYYDGRGLRYAGADGTWKTYYGPGSSWAGFDKVVGILDKLDLGGPLLDIGCSSGDFVGRALRQGIEAQGVDLSKDAVDMAPADVRERLLCADITKVKLQKQFKTTTAWDFWEHIWPKDLDALSEAIYAMTAPGGHHVAIICTRGGGEQDFVAEPGVTFTKQNSVILCSGHVHIRDWAWWATYFTKRGWLLASQRALAFNVAIASDPELRQVQSWSPRNLMLLRKPARRNSWVWS